MGQRNYSVDGTHSTVGDTILTVIGSASVQPGVFYLSLSSPDAAADNNADCVVLANDGTGAGTGTGVTPAPFTGAGTAAVATAAQTYSAEPTTYGSVPLLHPSFNQRSSYQWYANPGKEFYPKLAANSLLGVRIDAAPTATFNIDATFHFTE